MTAGAGVRIELLGGFRLTLNGQPAAGVLSSRLQSLIAYLALHSGTAVSRQQLSFLFWADSEESQARTNLRQLLHHLRSVLPDIDQYLKTDHQTLCWQPADGCTTDVVAFEEAATRGDLQTAMRLYRGDLLPAFYDDWIESERERLKHLYESVLDRLVADAEQRLDLRTAIRVAETRLARDTLREDSYQTLMRLHVLTGDRAGALRIYQQCADVLRRELDVEPGPATRRVRDGIMQTSAAHEPERRIPAPGRTIHEIRLVGREAAWSKLEALWRRAAGGRPSLVVLTGEAGIGKTRLLEELLDKAATGDSASIARTACYAGDRALAYTAAADWLRSTAILPYVQELPAIHRSQLARVLPGILLDQPGVAYPPPFSEAWQKRHFFEALARGVLKAQAPVLLAIDDLQWCDPETIEWLHYLIRFDPSARLLIAATARTGEPVTTSVRLPDQAVEIELGPLNERETLRLAEQIAGRRAGAAATESLYAQTRGNPLFVVETVRAGPSLSGNIPEKVHAVITGRLTQLSEGAQQLAAIASVIGRPFTVDLAGAVAGLPEDAVVQATDELWKHRVLQQDESGSYDFSHGLLRDVAYNAIGPARRRQLHRRVAEALEVSNPSEADVVCSQLAGHYERAGLPERAIPWYQRAARVIQRRFAEAEAIAYLDKALRLLEALPSSSDRDRLELDLLLALGLSLSATQGYASERAGKVYARARVLCEVARDSSRYFGVLAGSWAFHIVRAELAIGREIGERYLTLARENGDPMLLAAGHFGLGITACHLGSMGQAREHLAASCRHEDASERSHRFFDFGPELGVFCRAYLTHVTWLLGDPDEASEQSRQTIGRAESISHPFSLALALAYSAMLHHFRDEPELAQERAEAAAAVCRRYGFRYYLAWTPIIAGWAESRLGDRRAGLAGMLEGYRELRATGAALRAPYYLSLIAEAAGQCGDVDTGLRHLEEAMRLNEASNERWLQPELQRIRGDLLRQKGEQEQAITSYRNALRMAKQIGARSWEVRAEQSLAEAVSKTSGQS
ncbi:MAG TPA: AAA family ATPase [Bryobacteraceae bacterium]|jgi:DNA-binding SARP family transcriptional activator/predicted ATPase